MRSAWYFVRQRKTPPTPDMKLQMAVLVGGLILLSRFPICVREPGRSRKESCITAHLTSRIMTRRHE